MDAKKLKNCRKKYALIDMAEPVANENFDRLLVFIGKYRDFGKKDDIKNAYVAIKEKTNARLRGLMPMFGARALKTSKREIDTIRKCFKKWGRPGFTMKIPFKIEHIFIAIIKVLEDIKKTQPGVDVAQELGVTPSSTYGNTFYRNYIDTYKNRYDQFRAVVSALDNLDLYMECVLELENSFSKKFPFRTLIQ